MESQIWHQLAGCVGGGFRKWTMASACINGRHLVCHCLSSYCPGTGTKREWVWVGEGVCVCLLGASAVFSTDSIPSGFWSQKFWDLSSWHWNPGLGAWCWSGTLCSRDIPLKFLWTTHGWGFSPFWDYAPPTSLDGCGFFNSVVRLPFNSISDKSEKWLFYILIVILMWLCKRWAMFTYTAILTKRSLFPGETVFFCFFFWWVKFT